MAIALHRRSSAAHSLAMAGLLPDGSVSTCRLAALRPLSSGRVVAIYGADPESYRAALPDATAVFQAGSQPHQPGGLLLSPDPELAAAFLSDPQLLSALEEGMIVAAYSAASAPNPPPAAYRAHYLKRFVAGPLLRDARFAASQVAVLHRSAEDTADEHLLLFSNEPLPSLRLGLFEGGSLPALLPAAAARAPRYASGTDRRLIALASRLHDVEDRTLLLRAEILRLKSEHAAEGGELARGGSFDFPRTRHPWPLADSDPSLGEPSLYNRRPDDAALMEAQRGAAFMEAYDLLGSAPDFSGAVAALNAAHRNLQLGADRPDVSIIIPVYGQLSYTLNCLDSLFRHSSRFTAEIIILDDCSPDEVTAEFGPQLAGVRYRRQATNGGFIQTCNAGGEIAQADYVLLLNSDTRVVAGWLDEMIESFSLFPGAGLVGSKMLFPDGALQEAGSILWRDGSATNYGHADDPNRPQYCFAREVDYVSGCSVALPRVLWRALGGFDPHFAPAYAEDADLCQRVRAHGRQVWLQPASRVIHYEGKTSGTSTTDGVKAHQVANLRKLYLRWRTQFEGHRRSGDGAFFEKERGVRKRILFVDAVTPTPDQDAGSVQTVLALRCAQKAGYKAHFAPEDNWLFDPKYTPRLQREGVECAYAPFDVGFENYIRLYGWMFDVVVIYRVDVMHRCLALLRDHAPGAAALFHLADLHYLRLQRQAELEGDDDLARLARELKAKELDTIRQSDCTITHSLAEKDILAAEAPEAPVTVWPLMMGVVGTQVGFAERRDLCFLGGYRHPPNVDAVLWFTREVMPLIYAVRPGLRLIVAGANPTPEIQALASERIIVTGLVADLREVFDVARVFVCPLRFGAGAKGKIMSALSHGLPIVSTPQGIEGMGLIEGEHVLVAEGPAALAESVIRLDADPLTWKRLSEAGQRWIEERSSLDRGVNYLEEAIDKGHRKRLGLMGA